MNEELHNVGLFVSRWLREIDLQVERTPRNGGG